MFQRSLMRASRTASSAFKPTTRTSTFIQPISSTTAIPSSTSSRISSVAQPYLSRRWQSTEAAKEEPPATDAAQTSELDTIKVELDKKTKEAADFKDRYLRSVADYRNLQDRTTREQASARQFAIQKFATDLLDSIDNLDRALNAVPEASLKASDAGEPNADLLALHGGLKMSDEIMMNTLKKHGIERFDPQDREAKKFDPNMDEATFFTKVEGKNDGEVFYTQSKGYTLNGRVIRASKVGVVKNS